jgi:malonyl-CoA O-methyltransferase
MKSSDNVKASYAKWSQTYDHVENPTRDLDRKVIPKVLINLRGKDVIEAGCGTGKNTTWLAKTARSLKSFDLSEEMVNVARQKITGANVEFVQHNITERWIFPNDCCDVVTINLVLEHIEDIDFVFKEAYRVLRKNGKLFVCELHPDKQKKGTKARFTENKSNTIIEIDSYYHSKEDYSRAGKIAGFQNITLKDWFDEKESNQVPRLLSVLLKKRE